MKDVQDNNPITDFFFSFASYKQRRKVSKVSQKQMFLVIIWLI